MTKDSILDTTKSMLGGYSENDSFDIDLITHINTVFAILAQLGVGPEECFHIDGNMQVWSDFTLDKNDLQFAKAYMFNQVKLMFDPPSNPSHLQALKETIAQLEWRLYMQAETTTKTQGGD